MAENDHKPGTWGAFKAAMDAAGVQDSDGISYIDFSFPDPYDTRLFIERGQGENGEWWLMVH